MNAPRRPAAAKGGSAALPGPRQRPPARTHKRARPALRRALVATLLALGAVAAPVAGWAMGSRAQSPSAPSAPQGEIVPGEVLVQFQDGVSPAAREALLLRLGMRVKRSLGGQNAFLVTILCGDSVAEAIAKLQARPEVRSAAPNRLTRLTPPQPAPATAPQHDR